MTWRIEFRCQKCNDKIEWELPEFTAFERGSMEGLTTAMARSLSVNLGGVKLVKEEEGKLREFRF